MICTKCGATIPDDSVFCENCGSPLEPVEQNEPFEASEPVEKAESNEPPAPAEDPEEENEFREIEELEAMEEVEYDESEYDEDPDREYGEEKFEYEYPDETVDVKESDVKEESAIEEELSSGSMLPPIEEMEFEETGRPEGSEEEWLESFSQMGPGSEDVSAETEVDESAEEDVEELPIEELEADAEEDAIEEESAEEVLIEEVPFEETEAEADKDEYEDEETEIEEPAEEEDVPVEETAATADADEVPIEELEAASEEEAEEDPVEELEAVPEEEAEEDVPVEETEAEADKDEYEETEVEEPAEEEAEEDVAEEVLTEEVPVGETETEEEDASDEAGGVSGWLGSIGKQVHTGTGWAVDVAREKAAKIKDEKAIKADLKSGRDQWSEEEEGELDLGYNFWYRSNQPDSSSRYDGIEQEDDTGASDRPEDDATTYVAVKSESGSEKAPEPADDYVDAAGSAAIGDGPKAKKPVNKLKVTVIILMIAAVLGGAGIFATKTHTDNEQVDAYQASLTQAEQFVEAKDYASAEKIYVDLIAEYPDRAELYEALAAVYIAEKKYDDAKNTVNEGIARTGKSEAFTALSNDLEALTSTDWKEPFRRVLADNEWAVKRYDDANEASVALCDISGDKRPELLFFTQEYYGYGKLHIYAYEDEKAREVTYDCKNRSTQYQDAFYDIENNDSGYVVYKSKEAGKFGIYESFLHRGVDAWQTTNRYTISGSDCKRIDAVEACITTSYRVSDDDDEEESNTKYYIDDKEIKYDTYIKEFNGILSDIDEVIIASDNTAGDKEIWNRIMDMDEASMSYDGAMKILDEDAT